MDNETRPTPEQQDESKAFGVSIRALLAIMLVTTVCCMSVMQIEVKEPLYTLVGFCCGFYYGQKEKK